MITALDMLLPASRYLHLAALMQAVGGLFFLLLLPQIDRTAGPAPDRGRHRIRQLIGASLVVSILAASIWLPLQSLAMTGTSIDLSDAIITVATQTFFGRVFAVRMLALTVATLVFFTAGGRRRAEWLVRLLAGAALLLQPFFGHGATIGSVVGVASMAVHVLMAAIWLGCLLPLLLTFTSDIRHGAIAAARFSPIGVFCVILIAATALGQFSLLGDMAHIIGTPFGLLAIAKTFVFALLLALALANRFIFLPRVIRADKAVAAPIVISLTMEFVLGLAIIALAVMLADTTPAAHDTPVWPFSIRPVDDLMTDPFLRDRLLRMLLPPTVAILLGAIALATRRWFFAAAGIVVLLWTPAFALQPFYQAAFPTTFQQWDGPRTASSLQHGRSTFLDQCAGCHADDARGRGPLATGKPVWPPNLTAPLYRGISDGDMYWHIAHGMRTADGETSMPGFSARLQSDDIWMLVDFLRARSSAVGLDGNGRWTSPTRAPAMELACAGLTDTRDISRPGVPLLIVSKAGEDRTIYDQTPHLGTVAICSVPPARQEEWSAAVAILTGEPPASLATSAILIDASGWLRRRWHDLPEEKGVEQEEQIARSTPITAVSHHD